MSTEPLEPVKPWLSRDDRIIRFLTDGGILYGSQHHNLSAISPGEGQVEVKIPPHKGSIVIIGPAARELFEALCTGRATMIRKDGQDLLSVTFIPDPEDVEL